MCVCCQSLCVFLRMATWFPLSTSFIIHPTIFVGHFVCTAPSTSKCSILGLSLLSSCHCLSLLLNVLECSNSDGVLTYFIVNTIP